MFYWQDNESGKQGGLRTKDRRAAEKLLHAKNEAHRFPTLNLTVARAYLSAHDAKMNTRTWIAVMREMGTHGIASTQERCARTLCSKAFDSIRHKPLIQTTAEGLALNRSQRWTFHCPLSPPLAQPGVPFELAGLADPRRARLAEDSQQAPPPISSGSSNANRKDRHSTVGYRPSFPRADGGSTGIKDSFTLRQRNRLAPAKARFARTMLLMRRPY